MTRLKMCNSLTNTGTITNNKNSKEMNNSNKAFVRHTINELLFPILQDNIEREGVVDNILPEIVADINETADCNNFTSEDVRIALARIIENKFA